MKITKIDIKNFRAFYGDYSIDLCKSGKNLLVYGENGSGKSSLFFALKLFLNSHVNNHNFLDYRNIFVKTTDGGYLKLSLRENEYSKLTTYEWSDSTKETNDTLILDAAKTSGFVDYKGLLKTYFLTPEGNRVNIFDILVNNLLAYSVNSYTQTSFAEDWNKINTSIPKRNIPNQVNKINQLIDDFNTGLKIKLQDLQNKVYEIINKFECNNSVSIDFDFNGVFYEQKTKTIRGQKVIINVKFFNHEITYHHHFLNEAKLSAIALSIYFASLLVNPSSKLKILALDDVLIGLDMSHRLPVIDILNEYFNDYQIFFMTYDKEWYEILKQRTEEKYWKYVEFYYSSIDGEFEIPIFVESITYLKKAEDYFNANDYKASIIYLRTAFESMLKKFCNKNGVQVKYKEKQKELTSDDFWLPIKSFINKKDGFLYVDAVLAAEIELYRSIIMNPLSHSRIVTVIRKELQDAIGAVKRLETALK